jgi:hypothetical protein
VDCVSFINIRTFTFVNTTIVQNCGFIIYSNNFSSLCRHWIIYLGFVIGEIKVVDMYSTIRHHSEEGVGKLF